MEFKEVLISLRVKKGWKQYELADKLGISRQAVSKWEVGLCKPDLDNFIKLASLFEVSLDYLAGNNFNEYLIENKAKKNKLKKNLKNLFVSLCIFSIVIYTIFKFSTLFNILNV
jgi:transcriptional regulator with XRE-family HTH domain